MNRAFSGKLHAFACPDPDITLLRGLECSELRPIVTDVMAFIRMIFSRCPLILHGYWWSN